MMSQMAVAVFAEDAPTGLTLAEGSHLRLDTEKMYVDGIDGTITVGELKANFAGDVTVAGKADDAAVATDDVIGDYKALIYGDVNRDGKVNLSDVSGVLQSIAGWTVNVNTDAADVNKTGDVNLTDVTKLLKSIAGWADISLGNVRMVFENKALTAENEDSTLKLSFTNMMNKIGATQLQHTGENSHKIKLAKNEYESCQVLLWSDTEKTGMTAELSDFVYEYGDAVLESKLEWVVYEPTVAVFTELLDGNDGMYGDPQRTYSDAMPEILMPMADSFELKAERLQHFVINVKAAKDAPAGMYKATLTFKDADGKEVKKADVYAYVWDFTLPDAPYSASLFSGNQTVDNYEFLLENNLSDYILPYEITDPRADAYMSDPRVTAFAIAGCTAGPNGEYGTAMYANIMTKTPEQTVANYQKVMSNPEWAKKGLFYYTDEPSGDGLFVIKNTYEYVTELLGTTNIRNMTPIAGHSYPDVDHQAKNIDVIEYIDPYINVWCPQAHAYHLLEEKGKWTPRYAYNKYGDYADRARALKEKGEEIWWYVCVDPQVPYANYFTCYQGVINRMVSWQQYFNDVDGSLYYRTFGGTITKYKFDIGNGDGVLQYRVDTWGREGYGASWRLYQVRDGFDDFDYLSMTEELLGREAAMNVVKKVTTGMLRFTEDYRVMDAARDELAWLILEAQGK